MACVVAGLLLIAALPVGAQSGTKTPRLCFLTFDPGTALSPSSRFDGFFQGLRDLGYVHGETLAIDYLTADGRGERFPALAAESSASIFRVHRARVTELAARHRLPAMYPFSAMADESGGLMAYAVVEPYLQRRAATYVDRILKGARPAELAVQQPVLFNFVVNLKTARTLGISIPPSLIARADQVIE